MKAMDILMKSVLVAVAVMIVMPGPFVARSTGLSFENNRTISGNDVEEVNPDIAVNGSGDSAEVYIVYEYRDTANTAHVMMKRSTDGGRTFPVANTEDFLPSPLTGDMQGKPSVDVRGDDVCVVFQDNRNRTSPSFTAENVIVAAISHDGGENLSESVITPLAESIYPSSTLCDPNVCIDELGHIYVVFADNGRVWITYSLDNGTSWEYPTQVQEATNPSNLNYLQKSPSVSSNGEYVVVAIQSDPDYIMASFYSVSQAPTVATSFAFSELELLSHHPIGGSTPDGYYPRLAEQNETFHATYWDFSAEPSGYRNNDDLVNDRPGASYTRSEDNGSTFGVGSLPRVIVNSSQKSDMWHSMPDISVGSNGLIGVAWYDYTLGMKQPSVFVSGSIDGSNWSVPDRATNFHPDDYICDMRTGPRIAVDDAGECHVVWVLRNTTSSYGDVRYTRSSPNVPPTSVKNVQVYLDSDQPWNNATTYWDIVRDPDFKEYRIHLGNVSGFTPGPSTLLFTDQRQANSTHSLSGLDPDTQYYLRIGVEDIGGMVSYSEEVLFRTYPVNLPPPPIDEFPLIYMQEDTPLLNAINLTWYKEMGYIVDDHYNGYYGIYYRIEPWPGQDYIEGMISIRSNYTYVDLFPLKKDQVPSDVQSFNLTISDYGRDGIPDNYDDLSTVALIQVQMNATNDPPIWREFVDNNTNMAIPLSSTQGILDLSNGIVMAIEGSPYRFYIKGDDVDGDLLDFTSSDGRMSVSPDNVEFRVKAILEFTPTNSDVPYVKFNITMSDHNGGLRIIEIVLPVIASHEPPRFLTIGERPFQSSTFEFEMEEESTFEFEITAFSNEPPGTVTLSSDLKERVFIERPDPSVFSWHVSVASTNDDPFTGPISFNLFLTDMFHQYQVVPILIRVNNTPDMPVFMVPSFEFFFDYDEQDWFEWGGEIQPGGSVIRAEWGEPIRFVANATDPDRDVLNYSWTFTSILNESRTMRSYGKEVIVRFQPSDGILYDSEAEDYLIDITVWDRVFPPIRESIPFRIYPDCDNDNDGLPDMREKWFYDQLLKSPQFKDFDPREPVDKETFNFEVWKANYRGNIHYQYYDLLTPEVRSDPLKLLNTTGDPDEDGYTNYQEFGVHIPLYNSEKRTPYSLNMDFIDPFNEYAYPGTVFHVAHANGFTTDEELPPWMYLLIGGLLFDLLILAVGFTVIILRNRKLKRGDDVEIESVFDQFQRRGHLSESPRGSKYSIGEDFGSDGSDLYDLEMDKGCPSYRGGKDMELVISQNYWDTLDVESEPEIEEAYEELIAMDPDSRITPAQLKDRIKKRNISDDMRPEQYRELIAYLDRIEE